MRLTNTEALHMSVAIIQQSPAYCASTELVYACVNDPHTWQASCKSAVSCAPLTGAILCQG